MLITPLGHRIIVRFARKPIWMPTAPSKLFRIPEHKFYSEDEVKQIKVLDSAYKAQLRTIQEMMKHEFYEPATKTGGLPTEFMEVDNQMHRQALQENELENERVRQEREEFLKKRLVTLEETLLEEKQRIEESLAEAKEKIDKFVDEFDLDQSTIVTPDNFDQKIELAFKEPTNYEFFIDTKGKIHGKPHRELVPGPNNPLESDLDANSARQVPAPTSTPSQ